MDVDYYMKDSKIRDILDILRPPVKRIRRNSYQDYIGFEISDSDKRDLAQNKSSIRKPQRSVRSSLSLVLQKTCKKQIFEEYPFSTKNSPQENQTDETNTNIKPNIKVTVIPKRGPNCLFEFLDTKNLNSRKNKRGNTPCNNENSIATKNIYLVVAGKKDKIYEIKATGNKTSKDNPKDVRIKRFPSKMEEKRKKPLNFEGKLNQQRCSDANCACSCPKNVSDQSLEDEYPIGSSRVKIVGRIGLNEDDKYVMKCAATVNGQPVTTNYVPARTSFQVKPERINDPRRDIRIENTPVHFSFSDDLIEPPSECTTSQATQVDESMQLTRPCSTTDRNTQCNLCELCNNTDNSNFGEESKAANCNRSTNPLVIISVYPKPELKMYAINAMDTTSMNKFDNQTYGSTQRNETVRVNNFAVNTDLYNRRDTSPNTRKVSTSSCCPCEAVRKNDIRTIKDETKSTIKNIVRTNRASRSLSPAKRSTKSKTQEHKKDFTETTAKPKSRSPSPKRLNTNNKTNQTNVNISKQTKKVSAFTKRIDTKKQQNETPRSKSKACDKSVNTVTEESDKLIKKLTENKIKSHPKHILIKNDDSTRRETVIKKSLPKNEISKVSINIDSEKEFYDVVFEKGNTSTDLMVKRTAKDNFSQKKLKESFEQKYGNNEKHLSDSLENFFPMPGTGQHRRSASQAFHNENTDPLTTHNNMSRLNVRDSLEIGHSRDHSSELQIDNETDRDDEHNFFAPIKHFPGDDCIIDPIERDKEIRELLGIEKKRTTNIKQTDDFKHKMYTKNDISRRCIFRNTLCKSLAMNPILHWSSCAVNNQSGNICVPRRDEEKSITDDEKHNLLKLGTCTRRKKTNVNLQNRVNIGLMTKQQSTQYIAQEIVQLQRPIKDIGPRSHQKQNVIQLSGKQYRKVKKLMHKVNGDRKRGRHNWNRSIVSIGSVKVKRKSQNPLYYNKDVQTDSIPKELERSKSKMSIFKNAEENHTVVLFCKEQTDKINHKMRHDVRRVASSIEIRYTSIAYSNMGERSMEYSPIKDVKFGSNLVWKRRDSIETIFRGHSKSLTPNLGTSSLSLVSEAVKSTAESLPTDSKPRKPFLRRLMSCLVMRSESTTMKLPIVPKEPTQTLDSSIDSYHISTSLGAMDMSSSIYDTSASFYSNHTIGVVNNKTKRGFFSSVREFLSAKKNL